MRLFVGVELDDRARHAAEEAVSQLRQSLHAASVRLTARWAEPSKMHFTVRFLGQVPDDRSSLILDALRPPVGIPPFDVTLGSCGVFPSIGAPRVIWIGVAQGADRLAALAQDIDARLLPLGFAPDPRPFSAHLTLARVRDIARGHARAARETIATIAPARVRFPISAATVFRSHLSPAGSRYEPLASIALAG